MRNGWSVWVGLLWISAAGALAMQGQVSSNGDPCPRVKVGAPVVEPVDLFSANGTLNVTFKFKQFHDRQALVRYCYVTPDGNESPVLHVRPGDELVLSLQNEVPAPAAAAGAPMEMEMSVPPMAGPASGACAGGTMNASTTNLHFHGLNVPPTCHQDEVIHTLVQPNETFEYRVRIPANEPPGLYWYHPHVHGLSEPQVQGGASGPLIVEGIEDVNPKVAGLPERILVLRDQVIPGGQDKGARAQGRAAPQIPSWNISLNYEPVLFPQYVPGLIYARPGQKEFWRVVNAAADTHFDLQLLLRNVPQPLEIIGLDGVPTGTDTGDSQAAGSSVTNILLPPGARAEFIVTTPPAGLVATLVTRTYDTGPGGDSNPGRPVARLIGRTEAVQPNVTLGLNNKAKMRARFVNLETVTPNRERKLYFSEVSHDPQHPDSNIDFFITEDGKTPKVFDPNAPADITVEQGTVEDWTIENRSNESHDFHMHQIHFLVLEQDGKRLAQTEVRDTFPLEYWTGAGPYPSIKVRMDFRDENIIGEFVYHCHILEHEDGGMMGKIAVVKPASSGPK